MYSRNSELDQGWIAYGGTLLVHRTMEMDTKGTLLCNEVNPSTLKVILELCTQVYTQRTLIRKKKKKRF